MASAILQNRNGPRSTDYINNFAHNTFNFTRFHNFPNPNPNPNPNNFNGYRYIRYRISSFTKREVNELRKRLISDLERVRIVRKWICSSPRPVKEVTVGWKRSKPLPWVPVREIKKHCVRVDKSKLVMRKCGQILGKLMKHKHGWVFNNPVDVVSLNLYNYHDIITNPMDLGTIKSKLVKNEYDSPLAFADDVRLTFENAMLYNGKGSEVFVMAKRLLLLFEDLVSSSHETFYGNHVEKQKVAKDIVSLVVNKKKKKPVMTENEKTELRSRLSNLQLGDEGLNQIMTIVKKGLGLEQQGEDEIELDLAVIDNDTLWELHSFIDRHTKTMTCDRNGVMVSSVHNVSFLITLFVLVVYGMELLISICVWIISFQLVKM